MQGCFKSVFNSMLKREIKSSANHDACHLIEKDLLLYSKIFENNESKATVIHVNLGNTYPPKQRQKQKQKYPSPNDVLTPKGGQIKNDKC